MFGKIYQMRYLSGIVAGKSLARTNITDPDSTLCVAYIAAFPIPEVQRGINAFTLGCRSVFAACQVKVVWVGTWHSAEIETAAAHFFWQMERCDIITQHSDTTEPQLVYKAYGGSGIGYNSDMREIVGDSVLTAPMFNWGPIYEQFVQKSLTSTWRNESMDLWPGAAEGAVKLAPGFSPRVEPVTVQHVEQEHAKLRAAYGDAAFHHIFCGPLTKRWAYAYADGTSGPRAKACGNPVWRCRLFTSGIMPRYHQHIPCRTSPAHHA